MTLNKSRGQMYPWRNLYTWNPLCGKCCHECVYCYVEPQKAKPVLNAKYSGDPRIMEKELSQKLGNNRIIFVESMSDLFAKDVPSECIIRVLEHCLKYPDNIYLLQTKNPGRFEAFLDDYISKMKVILGTTLETNQYYDSDISKAPTPYERALEMSKYKRYKKMISIEPVIKFDIVCFAEMIRGIGPDFVSIGADSQNSNLVEPSKSDIFMLIGYLMSFTKIKIKPNLEKIVGKESREKLEGLTYFDIDKMFPCDHWEELVL